MEEERKFEKVEDNCKFFIRTFRSLTNGNQYVECRWGCDCGCALKAKYCNKDCEGYCPEEE